jgi:hypothetical protein
VAKAIWRSSPWALDTSVFAGMPISEWIKALINPHYFLNIPCEDVQMFQLSAVIVLDVIWRVRNDKVHNRSVIYLQGIIAQIRSTFDIHSRVWVNKSMSESWSCPPVGAVKLNFDVAVRSSFMVTTAVITDHDGVILAAMTRRLPYLNVNVGEA